MMFSLPDTYYTLGYISNQLYDSLTLPACMSVFCVSKRIEEGTPVHHLPHSSLRHQHRCVDGCTAGPMYMLYIMLLTSCVALPVQLSWLPACLPSCMSRSKKEHRYTTCHTPVYVTSTAVLADVQPVPCICYILCY